MKDTHTLEDPIKVAGYNDVHALQFRKPQWKDAKAAEKVSGAMEQTEFLISATVTPQLTPEQIDEISIADMEEIGSIIEALSSPKSKRGDLASQT